MLAENVRWGLDNSGLSSKATVKASRYPSASY
jgi:hypothetical protein